MDIISDIPLILTLPEMPCDSQYDQLYEINMCSKCKITKLIKTN